MNLDPYQRDQIRNAMQGMMDSIMFHNGQWDVENKLQAVLQALGMPYVQFESPGHAALFLIAATLKMQMQDESTQR